MSCNEERPFVYLLFYKGDGTPGDATMPYEPGRVLSGLETAVGCSQAEVSERVRADFFRKDPDKKFDPARLEVVFLPFCG